MEVLSDGRVEDASILWLLENAKFLLGPQLVGMWSKPPPKIQHSHFVTFSAELISRINEDNEPIFIDAAREPYFQERRARNGAARFIRCLDHSQLLHIVSTDQFSPCVPQQNFTDCSFK
jgi:hypothetical protein